MTPTQSYPISDFTSPNGNINFDHWIHKIVSNSADHNSIESAKTYIKNILDEDIIDFLFFYLKKQLSTSEHGYIQEANNTSVLNKFIEEYTIFKHGYNQEKAQELRFLTTVLDRLNVPELTPAQVKQAAQVKQDEDSNIRKLADVADLARAKAKRLAREAIDITSTEQYWSVDYHNQNEEQTKILKPYKEAAEAAEAEAKAAEAELKTAKEKAAVKNVGWVNTGFGTVVKVGRKIRKKYTISARRRSRRKITRKRSIRLK